METPATPAERPDLWEVPGKLDILYLVASVVFFSGIIFGIYDHNATAAILTSVGTVLFFIAILLETKARNTWIESSKIKSESPSRPLPFTSPS